MNDYAKSTEEIVKIKNIFNDLIEKMTEEQFWNWVNSGTGYLLGKT